MFLEQKEMSVLPERCSKAFTKMLESLPRVWKALSSEETLKALHKGSHRPSDRLLSAAAVEGQSEKRCLRHDLRRHTQADAVPCRQRLAVGAHKAKAVPVPAAARAAASQRPSPRKSSCAEAIRAVSAP